MRSTVLSIGYALSHLVPLSTFGITPVIILIWRMGKPGLELFYILSFLFHEASAGGMGTSFPARRLTISGV